MTFYNDELKKAFISEREAENILPHLMLQRMFTFTSVIETELDKDVSCFTTDEIRELYKIRNAKSIDVITNLNSQLVIYTQWCLQRNLVPDGINHYLEFNPDVLNTCVNKAALESAMMSPEEVFEIVRKMKNVRETFVLLMLYETGRSKNFSNIFNVKPNDFKGNGILELPDGRVVKVSKYLENVADETSKECTYYSTDDKTFELLDNGFIYKESTKVKNTTNIQTKIQRMRNMVKVNFDLQDIPGWIKLNSFVECGLVNSIKEVAAERGITSEEVLRNLELKRMLENQHNYRISPKYVMRKFGDFL